MSTISSKIFLSADGTKVYAEATGDLSKPALVFIHGLSSNVLVFDRQFKDPRLNENFYLVRYDMRGHGRSGHPREASAYQSIRYAEDFKAVCEEFELSKPSVLAWQVTSSSRVCIGTYY